jgi:hypothetical protein
VKCELLLSLLGLYLWDFASLQHHTSAPACDLCSGPSLYVNCVTRVHHSFACQLPVCQVLLCQGTCPLTCRGLRVPCREAAAGKRRTSWPCNGIYSTCSQRRCCSDPQSSSPPADPAQPAAAAATCLTSSQRHSRQHSSGCQTPCAACTPARLPPPTSSSSSSSFRCRSSPLCNRTAAAANPGVSDRAADRSAAV